MATGSDDNAHEDVSMATTLAVTGGMSLGQLADAVTVTQARLARAQLLMQYHTGELQRSTHTVETLEIELRYLDWAHARLLVLEARAALQPCARECGYTIHPNKVFAGFDGQLYCCERCCMQNNKKKKHGAACMRIAVDTKLSPHDPDEWHQL